MAHNNKSNTPLVRTTSDNQLPEWAKSNPDDNFAIDFAHPDAPVRRPGRYVSNTKVSLGSMQMLDAVYGKNTIALIDRRAPGRNKFKPSEIELPSNDELFVDNDDDIIADADDDNGDKDSSVVEPTPVVERQQNVINDSSEVNVGDLVVMFRGKVMGFGNINYVSSIILDLSSKFDDISDDDFVVFERIDLEDIVTYISTYMNSAD